MPAQRTVLTAWQRLSRSGLAALVWLFAAFALVAAPAPAQEHRAGQESVGQESVGQEHGEHAGRNTLAMSSSEIFLAQFSHSVPYPIALFGADHKPGPLTIYNVQPWQWAALVLLLLLFLPVAASFGRPSGRYVRVMRGFCLWIRDEMVYSVMGKEEGRAFVPLFLFLFFFLALQNMIGLLPSFGHHFPTAFYTATGTPYVTGAFAVITLLLMLGLGIKKNGVFGFFKGLVPHGLPIALVPIMFVIELVSLFVKPFALTIRLFANMLAGHLVIASAIGLIFLFTKMQGGAISSYLTALPCLGMAVFIYIIEAFVTLLQAYIFTFLSINFIYQSMHQEH